MPVPPQIVCQICGKSSFKIICVKCARRLNKEALHNEIEDETHSKILRSTLPH